MQRGVCSGYVHADNILAHASHKKIVYLAFIAVSSNFVPFQAIVLIFRRFLVFMQNESQPICLVVFLLGLKYLWIIVAFINMRSPCACRD